MAQLATHCPEDSLPISFPPPLKGTRPSGCPNSRRSREDLGVGTRGTSLIGSNPPRSPRSRTRPTLGGGSTDGESNRHGLVGPGAVVLVPRADLQGRGLDGARDAGVLVLQRVLHAYLERGCCRAHGGRLCRGVDVYGDALRFRQRAGLPWRGGGRRCDGFGGHPVVGTDVGVFRPAFFASATQEGCGHGARRRPL